MSQTPSALYYLSSIDILTIEQEVSSNGKKRFWKFTPSFNVVVTNWEIDGDLLYLYSDGRYYGAFEQDIVTGDFLWREEDLEIPIAILEPCESSD